MTVCEYFVSRGMMNCSRWKCILCRYDLMLACWSEQIAERPTFSDLREHLGDLLEDVRINDCKKKMPDFR